jgi:hypothetical protein
MRWRRPIDEGKLLSINFDMIFILDNDDDEEEDDLSDLPAPHAAAASGRY